MTRMASAVSSRRRTDAGRAEPGHAQVQRMVVRDDVGAPPGGDHRHVEELGEAQELGRGPGAQDAAAGEDHRSAGARQQLDDGGQLLGRRSRDARTVGLRPLEQHDLVEQVLRQRQEDRPGTAGQRLADGLRHDARDVLGAARLRRPLGEAADGRDLVDLLERLAALERALDLADEREHRAGVLAGGVDPDGQVGAADGPGAEAGGRAAGQLPVGLGHERRTALVAGGHDPDPRVGERVEQPEERLAGHGERVPDAGGAQGVRDEPADGPGLGRLRPRVRPARAAASGSAALGLGRRSGSAASGSGSARLGLGRPRPPRARPPRRGRLGRGLGRVASGASATSASPIPSGSVGRMGSGSVMVGSVPRAAGQYACGTAMAESTSPRTITTATTSITAWARRDPGMADLPVVLELERDRARPARAAG